MKRIIILIVGAVILPFMIQALMTLVAEPFYAQEPEWGILQAMGDTAGFAVGVICIFALPMKMAFRIALALLYWPIVTGFMFYWGFVFTGLAFGRWL